MDAFEYFRWHKDQPHEALDYVRQSESFLELEYKRIRKRAAEDPGTAGDQGEENWAEIIRQWLPSYFPVVTKGRILTERGYASPQLDVLVLSRAYPKILIDKKLYLAPGVVAAFECKTTLKGEHIDKAVATAAEIRRNMQAAKGNPYREICSTLIWGLLAHSHSWESPGLEVIETISTKLIEANRKHVAHPKEHIDCLTVAGLATWQTMKIVESGLFTCDCASPDKVEKPINPEVTVGHFCHSPLRPGGSGDCRSVLGAFVDTLYTKMAWGHEDMRGLATFFRDVRYSGSGIAKVLQRYPEDVFSRDTVRQFVMRLTEHRKDVFRQHPACKFMIGHKDYDEWLGQYF